MINRLLQIFLGKELILYNPHRNSEPIVNESNKKRYVFFNPINIWKATALVGRRSKMRYRLFYGILTLLNPIYIIDINWIDKRHSLYLVWCNNKDRFFIVIQHGIYHGGIVRFVPERYVKCNIFLVWGEHFKKMFERNNRGKDFQCVVFGNPCYNVFDRTEFNYKPQTGNSVLVAVSVIAGKRLDALYRLLEKLNQLGFDIFVKEHAMQMQKASEAIAGYPKISGSLNRMLKDQEYDMVITDVSSAMTDIIFFKNRAIYFSPDKPGSDLNDNVYSEYLENLAYDIESMDSREAFLNYIDLENQEMLLKYLIKTENTSNDLSQIEEYTSK